MLFQVFPKPENSAQDLMKYFSTPDNPVSQDEFFDFWMSLSLREREYFKKVDLI